MARNSASRSGSTLDISHTLPSGRIAMTQCGKAGLLLFGVGACPRWPGRWVTSGICSTLRGRAHKPGQSQGLWPRPMATPIGSRRLSPRLPTPRTRQHASKRLRLGWRKHKHGGVSRSRKAGASSWTRRTSRGLHHRDPCRRDWISTGPRGVQPAAVEQACPPSAYRGCPSALARSDVTAGSCSANGRSPGGKQACRSDQSSGHFDAP